MTTFEPPQRRQPRHPKYDAIHRALLTGLLSNIGTKGDTHEYQGARGAKFSIFPGSALFESKPKWLVSAELVETTKLYARTNGGVQPAWVEQAAKHLVERTHSEPRYEPKTASVVASERVTLFGLVLVPQRTVPFGPINPKLARELFIHNALVMGHYRTQAAFFRHNEALVAEVETLEAKLRARNLLADAATRFAFYDARVPPHVHSGVLFETWRREAERRDPHVLFMKKEDLLRADAPAATPRNYPDRLAVDEANLPLVYRYEPGEKIDGVTMTVPLAALAQMRPAQFEWLVPGMLEDKIKEMLRNLPGALRRNFVPVPDYAKSAAAALAESEAHEVVGLREALADYLRKQTGAMITAEDFAVEKLPDYMQMNFRLIDDTGRTLALGRDLTQMQRKFAQQATATFTGLKHPQFHRDGITAWTFGDLPDSVALQRHRMSMTAHPALVDAGETCGLRLLPSVEQAQAAHRAGLRRLFMIDHRRDVRYVSQHLPGFEQMALHYHLLGPSDELRRDLLTLIVDRALLGDGRSIRTLAAWEEARREASMKLLDTADAVCTLVAEILERHHHLCLQLDELSDSRAWQRGVADVHDHLVYLLPPGFLLTTPFEWLMFVPRYLDGDRIRLEKIQRGLGDRDGQLMEQYAPLWRQMVARREQHQQAGIDDAELETYRWLLEEYRVSLFAQELGTRLVVSARKLEQQWQRVRV